MNKPRMKKAKREKLAGKINARSQRRTRQAEDKQREARAGADHKNAAGRQAMKGRSTAKPNDSDRELIVVLRPYADLYHRLLDELVNNRFTYPELRDDEILMLMLCQRERGERKAGKR